MEPVRLAKKQQAKKTPIREVLDSDSVIRIKFYLVFALFIALFIAFCFMIQPMTYGYF